MSGRLPGKSQTPKVGTDKKKNAVSRGTQDELEIIGLIVTQNVGIRTLVFDRLRQARTRQAARQDIKKSRGDDDQAS